jgi:hypothetical protein
MGTRMGITLGTAILQVTSMVGDGHPVLRHPGTERGSSAGREISGAKIFLGHHPDRS